jgi:Zn-dependent protease
VQDDDFTIGPLRASLQVVMHEAIGAEMAIVKDGDTGKLYRFPRAGHDMLASISERGSAKAFVAARPEAQRAAVLGLLRQAQSCGLLDSGQDGASTKPSEGRSVLFLRLASINPSHLLTIVGPLYRPLFTRWAVLGWLLCWTWVAVETASQIGFFWQQMEVFTFFSAWVWVYGLLAVGTFFHELGHAHACHAYGGRVREVGIALYMGQIAAYANVSDAWLFKSKWQRIRVALAGIYYESYLALAALAVWIFAVPYTLPSQVALVFAVVAITRILLNVIPVLRLDGYWVLSDLLEEPNLRSRAAAYLLSWTPFLSRFRVMNFRPRASLKPIYIAFALASLTVSALALAGSYMALAMLLDDFPSYVRTGALFAITSLVVLSVGAYYRDILQRYFAPSRCAMAERKP